MPVLAAVGATLGPVGAIIGIAATLLPFFKNKNPQREHDTNLTNQAQEAAFQIWEAVSGENIRVTRVTAYPNVPKGAAGDLNIDIDGAIAQLNTTLTSAASQLVLGESRANPTYSNGGGGILADLQKVKEYRAAHPVATLASPGNLKIAGGLGLGLAGLLLVKRFI